MTRIKLLLAVLWTALMALASPAAAVFLTAPKAGVVDTLGGVVSTPTGFDMVFSHKEAAAGGTVSVIARRFDAAGRPAAKDLVFAKGAHAIFHPLLVPLSDTAVIAFWIDTKTGSPLAWATFRPVRCRRPRRT